MENLSGKEEAERKVEDCSRGVCNPSDGTCSKAVFSTTAALTVKAKSSQVLYISNRRNQSFARDNFLVHPINDETSGCGSEDNFLRLDSLADEPYDNFISFDQPDSELVDDAVVRVNFFQEDQCDEVGLERKDSIYQDAAECESCRDHNPAGDQHNELKDSHSKLSYESPEPESWEPKTAENVTCPDTQIKDKAICVNVGAKDEDQDNLKPSSRLEDLPPDFLSHDDNKNNRCSFKENNIRVDRRDSGLSFSVDSEAESFTSLRYDPIGLSMASIRSSDVVCHCRRLCRQSSFASGASDEMAAKSKIASTSFDDCTSTTCCDSTQNLTIDTSSPIPILSPSSSKSSVSSYFSLAPEGEHYWDDVLLGSHYASKDSYQVLSTQEPVQRLEKNRQRSVTLDSGWSEAGSTLSQSFDADSVSSDSSPAPVCMCRVCGCADRARLRSFGSGPFSPMWDWTYPTIEDVALALNPAVIKDPGDYKLGSSCVGNNSPTIPATAAKITETEDLGHGHAGDSRRDLDLSLTATGTEGKSSISNVEQLVSKPVQKPSSLSFLPPASTLSDSVATEPSTQPVVTLFNHSVNFWKMEID